jgi:hypothetical protein
MEQSGEWVMSADDLPSTLPGLGPKVHFEELEIQLRSSLGAEVERLGRESFIEMMHAQRERYEWFATQISPSISVEAHTRALIAGSRGPGATELALVSLSKSGDTTARAVLSTWQPPEHDLELSLFHQICLAEAFAD